MIAADERGESRSSRPPPRGWMALLGYDALAAYCAIQCALLLCASSGIPMGFTMRARSSAPALLSLRLLGILGARLHHWSFRDPGCLDCARLVLSALAASLAYMVLCPGLPLSFHVLEFFLAVSLMALFRFAPGLARDLLRSRYSRAKARFLSDELPRRALNVAVASVAMALSLPLWILIAAAIKLTSRGPVFYQQERVGLDLRSSRRRANGGCRERDLGGRPFMMYKFRTMRVDAEASTGAVWSPRDDPRVTPVGRLLRHSRLDELPQLLNVLKGDMNVVGPRPERPEIFAALREKIPDYPRRQRARPGITGHAQINQEYDTSVEDVATKVHYDLEYLAHQGVVTDLGIMARTIPVMALRDRMLAPRAPPAALDLPAGGVAARPERRRERWTQVEDAAHRTISSRSSADVAGAGLGET